MPAGRSAAMPSCSACGWPEHSISASASATLGGRARVAPSRELQPVRVDVGHGDLRRAAHARDLRDQQPDRAGAGDEHAVAGADAGLLARPQRDRQRLHQRAGLVAHAVGQRVREVLVHGDVAGEGAVGRRRAEEAHVAAEVVAARAALAAAPARQPGLERDAVADRVLGHAARRRRRRAPRSRGRARAARAPPAWRCARARSSGRRSRTRRPPRSRPARRAAPARAPAAPRRARRGQRGAPRRGSSCEDCAR